MRRTTPNAIVDTGEFFAFLLAAITGIVIWLYLPLPDGGEFRRQGAGLGAGFGQQALLGITRHTWADVHTYLGLFFIALVVLHLVLHWSYIKCLPGRFVRRVRKGQGATECET